MEYHGDRMSYKSVTKKTGRQECGQEQEEEVAETDGFNESEETDFWSDFDNLQKAKIIR